MLGCRDGALLGLVDGLCVRYRSKSSGSSQKAGVRVGARLGLREGASLGCRLGATLREGAMDIDGASEGGKVVEGTCDTEGNCEASRTLGDCETLGYCDGAPLRLGVWNPRLN